MSSVACRCGHEGQGDHPCHAKAYRCGKPARERFYDARPAALSGMQMKYSVTQTWACDDCWEEFQKIKKLRESV